MTYIHPLQDIHLTQRGLGGRDNPSHQLTYSRQTSSRHCQKKCHKSHAFNLNNGREVILPVYSRGKIPELSKDNRAGLREKSQILHTPH